MYRDDWWTKCPKMGLSISRKAILCKVFLVQPISLNVFAEKTIISKNYINLIPDRKSVV